MIVQKLKPHVSTFSEALLNHYQHGDEVKVGGEIIDIFNMAELLPKDEDGNEQEGIYLTLDDGVGLNHIVVPSNAYYAYKKLYQLEKGSIVLAHGRVYELDTTHTYENKRGKTVTVDKHKNQTVRILAWDVLPLPEKTEQEVE